MRLFNFKIDSDLDARLKAYNDRTGVPMSEVVRRALNDYLEARERPEKRTQKNGLVQAVGGMAD